MLNIKEYEQSEMILYTMDELVPKDSLFRKIDAEYRWFLGIPFGKSTPHYSTFSQNYIRRYAGTEVFENIFVKIVGQAINYGLVKGETFFTDSTY